MSKQIRHIRTSKKGKKFIAGKDNAIYWKCKIEYWNGIATNYVKTPLGYTKEKIDDIIAIHTVNFLHDAKKLKSKPTKKIDYTITKTGKIIQW